MINWTNLQQLAAHDADLTRCIRSIERLRWIDTRLRSRNGLILQEAAEWFGVTTRTIRRDIEVLASAVGAVATIQVTQYEFVRRYAQPLPDRIFRRKP